MNGILLTEEEYVSLKKSEEKLSRLESGGVDNWVWYSESLYGTDYGQLDWEDTVANIKEEAKSKVKEYKENKNGITN